ncbi:hypothetical protein DL990_22970 [Amycolatopsis sp. WAC 01416]|uniref:hypothetical protein n=1 Tax=Amycolatopsis sp. WAC 01416 TaxID=2203196 RepID=UPI000F79833C|nr:hypothetical protein [Amycolatopsis sp. WAC 01416]RSN30822.1 hypothetical protein DL990_22970 [Amycolatopsis sp. WAC 01416]
MPQRPTASPCKAGCHWSAIEALWKSYRVGGYCAEATGSATGTVAIENIDGSILTFAVKSQPNTITGTEWVSGLVPIRGVFNGNGATTVTPWHSSVQELPRQDVDAG